MPILSIALSEAEVDAVAASLPGDPATADVRVLEYLDGQLRNVVGQHVKNAKKAALKADGLPEALADVGLADDEVAALKAIRADKAAALEAAKG